MLTYEKFVDENTKRKATGQKISFISVDNNNDTCTVDISNLNNLYTKNTETSTLKMFIEWYKNTPYVYLSNVHLLRDYLDKRAKYYQDCEIVKKKILNEYNVDNIDNFTDDLLYIYLKDYLHSGFGLAYFNSAPEFQSLLYRMVYSYSTPSMKHCFTDKKELDAFINYVFPKNLLISQDQFDRWLKEDMYWYKYLADFIPDYIDEAELIEDKFKNSFCFKEEHFDVNPDSRETYTAYICINYDSVVEDYKNYLVDFFEKIIKDKIHCFDGNNDLLREYITELISASEDTDLNITTLEDIEDIFNEILYIRET